MLQGLIYAPLELQNEVMFGKCDPRPKTLCGKIVWHIKLWQVKRILKGGKNGRN